MFRTVLQTWTKHGRQALENVFKQTTKPSKSKSAGIRLERESSHHQFRAEQLAGHVSQASRKSTSLLSRFLGRSHTSSLAHQLRQKFISQSSGSFRLFGSTPSLARHLRPLYTFAAVGLATGSLLKEHGINQNDPIFSNDSVCACIREMLKTRLDWQNEADSEIDGNCCEDLEFGPVIDKGCNAVVYSSRMRTATIHEERTEEIDAISEELSEESLADDSEMSFEILSSESELDSEIEVIVPSDDSSEASSDSFEAIPESTEHSLTCGKTIHAVPSVDPEPAMPSNEFDLAVKMMFNLGIESSAMRIIEAMEREVVPSKDRSIHQDLGPWHDRNRSRMKDLPSHPNIVEIKRVFVDDIPALPEGLNLYPQALPPRLNPEHGFGRNKTLFIIMKRYDYTVREYLNLNMPCLRERLMLLTQLTEAILHLTNHGIAHRDLKTNNLLLDCSSHVDVPRLVVADFGCCSIGGLSVPFTSRHISRDGNRALMAPEISRAKPGLLSYLDYSKADLWAAGALAYEFLGSSNPFYGSNLDSCDYTVDDLPPLSNDVPLPIQKLVHHILTVDPNKRPSPQLVADMLHVLLWGPESWRLALQNNEAPPVPRDLQCWVMTLTAEVILQPLAPRSLGSRHVSSVEHELKRLFLSHVELPRLVDAVNTLWSY